MIELDEKKRIIQEFVPGKQVTLAHVIANPTEDLPEAGTDRRLRRHWDLYHHPQ